MNLNVTINDAIDYAAAFASGGMKLLRRTIRQKGLILPDREFDNTDRLLLHPDTDGPSCVSFQGGSDKDSTFLGGRCWWAGFQINKFFDRDNPKSILGHLSIDMGRDGEKTVIPIFRNSEKNLPNGDTIPAGPGGTTDTHYINGRKVGGDKNMLSFHFKPKNSRGDTSREPVAAAADDDPFGF